MKIVCLSDTHGKTKGLQVPDGDVLVHAGDATMMGKPHELKEFDDWLGQLPHATKIFVPGNHDWLFSQDPLQARAIVSNAHVLINEGFQVRDGAGKQFSIHGSPVQPAFCDWAFNIKGEDNLKRYWEMCPAGVDVLVTHGPPFGILDEVPYAGTRVGSTSLLDEVLTRIKPKLMVFGHIHHSYGQYEFNGTTFVNASTCNERYLPVNPAIVVEV